MNNYTHILEEKYKGKIGPEFLRDLERIEHGEPLAYVIGFIPFLNTKIDLSERPLLPRVETEFWVHKALSDIDTSKKLNFLDIFSGSGCIGIALLKSLQKANLTFAEKNPDYIKQISLNVSLNKIKKERVTILKTDCFSNIKDTYDFIFANPPYIARNRKRAVEASVLKWEPESALFAPDNGLFYIKKLLREAPSYLAPGGTLFIEFDSWQKESIEEYIRQLQLQSQFNYSHTEFWKDQYNKWRVLKAVV